MIEFDKFNSTQGAEIQVIETNSISCPICGEAAFFKFSVPCDYRKPHNSQDYKVYWCNRCDYGAIGDRPSKEKVKDFYQLDDYYTHNAANTKGDREKTSFFDRLRIHLSYRFDKGENFNLSEVFPFLTADNPTICEIGCGNGKNLSKFVEKGYTVYGVEPDPAAREVARKITPHIFDGTAEELPQAIKNQKYDLVIMSHVLEHCLDINVAMSNVKEILKDGGIYVVEIPNCNSLGFKTYRGEWPWSDIPRHLNFFTKSSLDKILIQHGFKVEAVKYNGFCRQFSNDWLNNEREIWTAFCQYGTKQQKEPNFKFRSWKLLLRSIFASATFKYDSVRLIGIKY